MTRLAIVTLALIGTAGFAHAQSMPIPEPARGPIHTDASGQRFDSTGTAVDANGNRYIGGDSWVRGPGDSIRGEPMRGDPMRSGYYGRPGAPRSYDMAAEPAPSMALSSGPHGVAFRDEFGFRYDSEGNRLDHRGYVISPQTRMP